MLVSIAVLAGGQSTRMGQNKAFLPVGGRRVIERVLDVVAPLTDDLFIGANSPEEYREFGLRLAPDVYPNKAALGGIYSAIHAAQHSRVLVVACDMPFLKGALLQYLIELAPTAAVVVPLIEPGQPETLHAIYSKACLPAIEPRLLANRLRIIGFFEEVPVRYVARAEVAQFDPHFHSFLNMNTPAEWARVQAIAATLDEEHGAESEERGARSER
ncbi:MAG: molybdenum cofactor guanylyltransferase [Chloroflexota bacterium]